MPRTLLALVCHELLAALDRKTVSWMNYSNSLSPHRQHSVKVSTTRASTVGKFAWAFDLTNTEIQSVDTHIVNKWSDWDQRESPWNTSGYEGFCCAAAQRGLRKYIQLGFFIPGAGNRSRHRIINERIKNAYLTLQSVHLQRAAASSGSSHEWPWVAEFRWGGKKKKIKES